MFTRLRRRLPVRVRHHWKLLAFSAAVVAAAVVLAGNVQVRPIVTSGAAVAADTITEDIAGRVDLFDESKPHTLSITFLEADYQRAFDSYMNTGDKDWMRADVTIDGTLIRDVGMRLKGNSTLSRVTHNGRSRSLFSDRGGLRQGGGVVPQPGGGGMPQPGGGQPGGGQPGGGQPGGGVVPQPGGVPGGMPGGFRFGGGGPMASLDSSRPEELPWLLSFDKFSDGRRYQGRSEIALRVSGMGGGAAVLNEAVSLAVLEKAGQTTQGYAYAGLRVNDRPVKARLLVEHPDEDYAGRLGGGVLYKSLAGGQFTYQGEDPTAYEDDFKQVNGEGSHDLKPVIDLIKWVSDSSDAEFAARLGDHIDVGSFAEYVAAQNLLLNFDDMAGPGHNYYLWYDVVSKKFTVLSWDHNLTFSGNAAQGPRETGGLGGMPGGVQPRQPAGGRLGGHKLKERFLAAEAFKAVYDNAYRDLYRQIYAGNAALDAIGAISATLGTVDGADAAAIKSDADRLRALVQQRTAALAADKVITG